jgi:hypothetical protein
MTFKMIFLLSLLADALSLTSWWATLPLAGAEKALVGETTALVVLWLGLFGLALWRFGLRTLWLLVGLPLVAFAPGLWGLIAWPCRHSVCL